MIKFNLSKDEQRRLRRVCWYTGLHFNAMAARPQRAKQLIAEHYETALKAKRPFDHENSHYMA